MKTNVFVLAGIIGSAFPAFAAGGGPIIITLSGGDAATGAASITVDGSPYTPGTLIQDTVFPTQHCVRIEGVHVQRWSTDGGIHQPPLMDGNHWLMGSTNASVTVTHTAYVTTNAYWVDPVNGVDSAGRGTQAQPFRTPLYAAERAGHNSVIYCAEGDYCEGEYYFSGMTNRVYNYGKNLRFVGAGIGKSILHGKLDLESPTHLANGRGPAAMRAASFSGYAVIQNFTVTDGRCASVSNGNVYADQGGAGYSAYFADCLITNCAAYRGQVIYNGTLVRCRVSMCDSPELATSGRLIEGGAAAYCCVFDRQNAGAAPPLQNKNTCWHCTAGYRGNNDTYVYGSGAEARNCATVVSRTPSDSWSYSMLGCVTKWSSGTKPSAQLLEQDVLDADPLFIDAAAGDYRLFALSPAVGYGYLPEDYYKVYSSDINGSPIIFKNGRPTAGAVQEVVSGLYLTATSLHAELNVPEGYYAVEPGGSMTVSVVRATRPPVGFVVNGETVPGTSYTFTAPAAGEAEACVTITGIVIGTNWYVNAAMPDDGGDGFTPATAKRTLSGAMTNEHVVAGDVIHAAEGNYDEGDAGGTGPIKSRVYVKPGVTLTADGAMEKTLIIGAPAPVERSTNYPGCGEGAVRCAWVSSTGVLRGFVITNGYTEGDITNSAGKSISSTLPECYGGGILGGSNGRIEDCLITQCRSVRGSGACGGSFRRCRFVNITNPYTSWSIYALTEVTDSYFDFCGELGYCPALFANNFVGKYAFDGTSRVRSLYAGLYEGEKVVRNCMFCAPIRNISSNAFTLVNCVYTGVQSHGPGFILPTNAGFGGVMSYADITAQLAQDEQGFWTIKKESVFVDQDADTNAWAMAGPMDIGRSQRVYNAALDIGPWEYDWRGEFASALGYGGVEVAAASPGVTTNALGKVRLTDGATVTLTITDAQARTLAFSVENGTLSARGGKADISYDADGVYPLKGISTLVFSFLGEGHAVLDRITNARRLLLLVR